MILQQKRMLTLVLLGFLLSPAIGLSLKDPEWEYYKLDYNKSYTDMAEEIVRREIWLQNRMLVEKHNRLADEGYHTYWLKINHFADLTTEERHKITRGLNIEVDLTSGNDSVRSNNTIRLADLPASVDWRQKGYVTPVKYQGHCGSCYAFSTTGAIEGLHAKRTGRLISLSEQNIVDCTENFGNHGCHGGQMDRAFRYVISNGGIDTEAGYPYMAEVERCHYQSKNKGASISGFVDILPRGDESRLQIAVGTIGPVSVGIDSRTFGFHFYSHGVYSSYSCSSIHLSHAVLIVGYGTDTWGSQYWLVKNSWGKRWGEDGYVRMARNHDNMCGIATLASYPV